MADPGSHRKPNTVGHIVLGSVFAPAPASSLRMVLCRCGGGRAAIEPPWKEFQPKADRIESLLRHTKDESVDLVYLDPPFKSNQDYNGCDEW